MISSSLSRRISKNGPRRPILGTLVLLAGLIGTAPGVIEIEESLSLNTAAGIAAELSFDSEVGVYYQVEISGDMLSWDNEGYSIKGTGGRVSTLVSTRGLENAYYRISENGDPNNTAPAGESAYEVWLGNGNAGSVDDFLAAISGPPGPSGPEAAPVYLTRASAELAQPAIAPDFLITRGFSLPGDGGGARFKRVFEEPTHEGKLAQTLEDGMTVVWYEIVSETLRPEMFGAFANDTDDAAAAAAKAIEVIMARGGGVLAFEGPGTYRLESQGIHPNATGHQVAIHIPGDNVEIVIAPQAALKLADNQQTGAASPVEIISWGQNRSNIHIHGGGAILGNAAGQSGWTGGYQQNDGGNIISSFGGGDRHIRIENLRLEDFFSSPINLGGDIRSSDVRLRGLRCRNTGEGAQIVAVDGVSVEDHWQEDDLDIQGDRGDALELADCTDFLVSAVRIKATGATVGAGIDLFSSCNGVVDGFVIDGWNLAFDVGTSGTLGPVDRVRISDGVIRNIKSPWILGLAQGRLTYSDIAVYDCPSSYLFQLSPVDTNAYPPVVLNDVKAENIAGALILGGRELIWHGGGIRDSAYGISINYGSPGDQVRRVDLKDLSFSGIATPALRVFPGSEPYMAVLGRITDIRLEGPSDFSASSVGDFSGCEMRDFSPRGVVGNGTVQIAPFEILTRSATNLTTLKTPSLNQQLVVRATGAFTVIDASSPGGQDIHLSGGNDFSMGSGDRLTLDYDGTGWHEVSRSDN